MPVGVAGELYVSGEDSPAVTGTEPRYRRRFVADPRAPGHTDVPDRRPGPLERERRTRVPRSRRLPGQDRGFRIELGEIEAVSQVTLGSRIPSLTTLERDGGAARIVGYVVPDQRSQPLNPEAVIALGDIRLRPRTWFLRRWSSWTNCRARPTESLIAEHCRSRTSCNPARSRAAESDTEARWPHCSPTFSVSNRAGVDDSFFSLGGDSIMSIQLVARVGDAGLGLTPRDVFEAKSVAGLAVLMASPKDAAPEVLEELPGRRSRLRAVLAGGTLVARPARLRSPGARPVLASDSARMRRTGFAVSNSSLPRFKSFSIVTVPFARDSNSTATARCIVGDRGSLHREDICRVVEVDAEPGTAEFDEAIVTALDDARESWTRPGRDGQGHLVVRRTQHRPVAPGYPPSRGGRRLLAGTGTRTRGRFPSARRRRGAGAVVFGHVGSSLVACAP